jgi:glycosyltransferase involved in cell wall biosynthesis
MNFKNIPLVSVFMITYNHENFICQALEGILMQQVNFEYEIVLGEDCSTDNTRRLILEYAQKYPNKFKLILHDKNVGAMANEEMVMNSCIGKYIAMCEGDDYWTDPMKLQKQVDFLEMNEEYAGCAHQSIVINDKNDRSHLFRSNVKEVITTIDLINHRLFHTASFFFRKKIIEDMCFYNVVNSSDRLIFFLVSFSGPIHYSFEPMCVYRKNENGMSSVITIEELEKDFKMIPWLVNVNHKFPKYKYKSFLHKVTIDYAHDVTLKKLIYHLSMHFFYSFSSFPKNLRQMPSIVRIFIRKIKIIFTQ